MRAKRAGDGAQAISSPPLSVPALGHPEPPASVSLHGPSSIPSSWPLGQGTTLSPQNPCSFHLIPYPCFQHPTICWQPCYGPGWVSPLLISQPWDADPEKLRRGWDAEVSGHREGSAGVRRPQAPLRLPGGHTGRNPAVLVTNHTKRTPCFSPVPFYRALRSRGTLSQGASEGQGPPWGDQVGVMEQPDAWVAPAYLLACGQLSSTADPHLACRHPKSTPGSPSLRRPPRSFSAGGGWKR